MLSAVAPETLMMKNIYLHACFHLQRQVGERDPLLGGSSAPIANGQRPV